MTSKKDSSERDICTQYIQPALVKSGWDTRTQIREEVSFNAGQIHVQGNFTDRGNCSISKERMESLKAGKLKTRPIYKPIHTPKSTDKIAKIPMEWMK